MTKMAKCLCRPLCCTRGSHMQGCSVFWNGDTIIFACCPLSHKSASPEPPPPPGPFPLSPPLPLFPQNFQRGLRISADRPCLGSRAVVGTNAKGEPIAGEFQWQTYAPQGPGKAACLRFLDGEVACRQMRAKGFSCVRLDPATHLHSVPPNGYINKRQH